MDDSRLSGDAIGNLRKSDAAVQDALDRLRVERDATVSAGLPTKYNQQTLVGNISGAGNRHVIEDQTPTRTRINVPNPIQDAPASGSITVQTRDGGGFGAIVQQVTGVDTITFDSAVFLIQDNGGGEVVVYCAT